MRVRMVTDPTWGDNGKGKVTDYLLNGPWKGEIAVNARWNGGSNAGHRVMRCGKKFDLHMIPSSILTPGVISLIAPNCVIDLQKLVDEEIPTLLNLGGDIERLRIAKEAFLIMPWHLEQERLETKVSGGLGTTMKGIGPAYADITARYGLMVGDLLDHKSLEDKLRNILTVKQLITGIHGMRLSPAKLADQYAEYGEKLRPLIVELDPFLYNTLGKSRGTASVLHLEGAQGAALDIHAPNYPFNTSSGTTYYDASKIFRLGNGDLEYSIGVTKPYCTSVGRRDFPTKMNEADAQRIRKAGDEFGTTTGRPRDCGWLDLPMLRHGARMMAVTHWFITKLDVLDNEPEIFVCTHYKRNGEVLALPPRHGLHDCEPVYVSFRGWLRSTREVRGRADLPPRAQSLLGFIEEQTDKRIIGISVGPEPDQTIC
ncbi:MAG: Adenylosuccinate synthetase PurA [Parcubacteria group bacterium GW2011_GWA2_51_12]|nr:MAG: Adenylosuccinate synthetase PurA [Parcubacteria group bacterium GW2011_GWA2_51_12]